MSTSRRTQEEVEQEQTLREWNLRMDRLNSIDSGFVEPKISAPYTTGGLGYAGFYHYMTSNDHSKKPTSKTSHHPNRNTNFERWISEKRTTGGRMRQSDDINDDQSTSVSQSELKEIQRCFYVADSNRDGYLDCEELKNFMELRGAPITHWDARKLLKAIDPHYQAYISLDQVMYLVVHCGITTDHEVPITSEEFNRIIKRMRIANTNTSQGERESDLFHRPQTVPSRGNHQYSYTEEGQGQGHGHGYRKDTRSRPSRIIQNPIVMDNSRSFFEEMASDVAVKQQEERLYKEYRRELRENKVKRNRKDSEKHFDEGSRPKTWTGPPGWQNMILHSQDPNYHVPPIVFKDVRRDWEDKINPTRDITSEQTTFLSERKVMPSLPLPLLTKLKFERTPRGLPASAFRIPGRPQPFVVTQNELQDQLAKIRGKRLSSNETKELTTDLLFKRNILQQKDSKVEVTT